MYLFTLCEHNSDNLHHPKCQEEYQWGENQREKKIQVQLYFIILNTKKQIWELHRSSSSPN